MLESLENQVAHIELAAIANRFQLYLKGMMLLGENSKNGMEWRVP